MLHYSLYILRQKHNDHKDKDGGHISMNGKHVPFGKRGSIFYGNPDIKGVLENEVNKNDGKIIITGILFKPSKAGC